MARTTAATTMPAMAPPLREEEGAPGSELSEVAPGSREPERDVVDVGETVLVRGEAVDEESLSSDAVELG